MALDLSQGFLKALGISEQSYEEYLDEVDHPFADVDLINALLQIGSEPFGAQLDAVIENVGHLNLTVESLGFIHVKRVLASFLIADISHQRSFGEFLGYFKEKGELSEEGLKFCPTEKRMERDDFLMVKIADDLMPVEKDKNTGTLKADYLFRVLKVVSQKTSDKFEPLRKEKLPERLKAF